MKIAGQEMAIREVMTVKLPRAGKDPIILKVCGIPIGFNAEYEKIFPRPRPPHKIINFAGGKTTKEENYEDIEFLTAHKSYEFHKNIYLVYRGLKADSSLVFDSLSGREPTCAKDLENLSKEFSDAGFSEGDINIIMSGVHAASHIDQKEVDAAISNF
jgi:hypothetical protein